MITPTRVTPECALESVKLGTDHVPSQGVRARTLPVSALRPALVRRRLWHFITQDDEDRAQTRLREHFYGGRGEGRPQAPSRLRPSLSKDALFVSDVSAKLRQRGFLGDVFSVVSRELPEWTRARWENAWDELSTARERREGERGCHRASDVSVLETLQVR